MTNLKSIIIGTAVFSISLALPISAQADDANKAFEGATKCYAYEFDDPSLNVDEAILVCAQAVADLTAVRSIDGKDIGIDDINTIADIAGTVAMKWAALAYKKSGGTVTSDVCQPVGFAYSLYDILDEPKASKSKEDSGADMLADLCKDAGVSLQ